MAVVLMRSLAMVLLALCGLRQGAPPPPKLPVARRLRMPLPGDCWQLEVLIPPGACDTLG